MSNNQKQKFEARIKEIEREITRVDTQEIIRLLKEKNKIEKKLGYTLDPLYSCS